MPGGFPGLGALCNPQDVAVNLTNYSGTSLNAPSTANTKSAWQQLIAATSYDSCALDLCFIIQPLESGGAAVSFDIGIGGSGSEVTVIQNIAGAGTQYEGIPNRVRLPIGFPAGTRIAARSQNSNVTPTQDIQCFLELFDGDFLAAECCAGVDALGFNAATSLGTIITPSASAGVKGSYSQIISATSQDYCGIFFTVNNNFIADTTHYPAEAIDIAVGAGGSEQVIFPNFMFQNFGAISSCLPSQVHYCDIPAGTRIAARSSDTSGTATNTVGVIVYGIYK